MNRNDVPYANFAGMPRVQRNLDTTSTERNKMALFKIGIVEMSTGLLCIILGSCTLGIASNASYYGYYHYEMTYPGQGIWCGLFAIMVGILGVAAKSKPSISVYNANMVLSIIGANLMGVLTILSGVAALKTQVPVRSVTIIHLVLGFLGLFGIATMIIHSAYCCSGVCNKTRQRNALSYHQGPIGIQ